MNGLDSLIASYDEMLIKLLLENATHPEIPRYKMRQIRILNARIKQLKRLKEKTSYSNFDGQE